MNRSCSSDEIRYLAAMSLCQIKKVPVPLDAPPTLPPEFRRYNSAPDMLPCTPSCLGPLLGCDCCLPAEQEDPVIDLSAIPDSPMPILSDTPTGESDSDSEIECLTPLTQEVVEPPRSRHWVLDLSPDSDDEDPRVFICVGSKRKTVHKLDLAPGNKIVLIQHPDGSYVLERPFDSVKKRN